MRSCSRHRRTASSPPPPGRPARASSAAKLLGDGSPQPRPRHRLMGAYCQIRMVADAPQLDPGALHIGGYFAQVPRTRLLSVMVFP